ncbi:MAG: TlyA family rRNA (cytidine-2'-O)-methyltransferase [Parasphingorhabdus sp.]
MSQSDKKPAKTVKKRVDQLLVDLGLAESKTKAQAYIMAGLVSANGRKLEKPGQQVASDLNVELKGKDHPWVSRGGLKLDHALKHFDLDVSGMTAIDVGSSTGGFTDVLLENGVTKVFAVDSGTNQLAWKLRQDPRVLVHEQTSARILTDQHITDAIDLIVCDASFISLTKVLERPMNFAKHSAWLMALIKPQFEAEREQVGKGGVVRDAKVHKAVCDKVENWLEQSGWSVEGITKSPITGPKGNVEFLIAARKGD